MEVTYLLQLSLNSLLHHFEKEGPNTRCEDHYATARQAPSARPAMVSHVFWLFAFSSGAANTSHLLSLPSPRCPQAFCFLFCCNSAGSCSDLCCFVPSMELPFSSTLQKDMTSFFCQRVASVSLPHHDLCIPAFTISSVESCHGRGAHVRLHLPA